MCFNAALDHSLSVYAPRSLFCHIHLSCSYLKHRFVATRTFFTLARGASIQLRIASSLPLPSVYVYCSDCNEVPASTVLTVLDVSS